MAPEIPLHTIPEIVWPPLPHVAFSQVWALMRTLERTQWLPASEILDGQLTQARLLLAHCLQHVPYYQETLRKARIKPAEIRTLDDFRHIPLLSRRTYQEQYPRLQARSLPEGTKGIKRSLTSGTSGTPIEVVLTNITQLMWWACCFRDFQWCAFDLRGSLATIRSMGTSGQALHGSQIPCWLPGLETYLATGPTYVMAIQQDPRRQLEWLRQVRPNYLLTTPTNAAFLADLLVESGQRLPDLRAVQVIAEMLTAEGRERIEAGFGVPVKNLYSCVEAGYLASPCPQGTGQHVHAENVLLEVLREDGQPCEPGETGQMVLTSLHNFATPFVRYAIGDLVTLGGPCPCGRGLPLLTGIEGKQRPKFLLPDGRRKDSSSLVTALRNVGGYHQHQLIQRGVDHVLIRLVPQRHWSAEHAQRVVEGVHAFFEMPIRVEIELVERIPLTAGGKLREIIVEMDQGASTTV